MDKKPLAAILVSKMSKPEPENEEKSESNEEQGKIAAVEDMMGAMKSNDPKMFRRALENFLMMCE